MYRYMHSIFNNRRTKQGRNQSRIKNMMMMNSQQQQLQQQQLQQQYQQQQHQHQQQQQQQQQQQRGGISSPHWTAKETDDDIKEDQRRPGVLYLSARSLNIVWGNDKRFWQWVTHNQEQEEQKQGSHYHHAELLQVNWIEVSRKLSFNSSKLCPLVAYDIYYVVKFKADAFGWHSIPIKFKVKQTTGSANTMETEGKTPEESEISEILESYRKSHDVWQCIYGGQFTVPADRQGFVEFGMFEVDSDWWKGSMVLHGVKLEAKRSTTEPNKLNIEA